MPRFHHANLGVPPDAGDTEGAFLVEVLGYRVKELPPDLVGRARWYVADDGSEIHLSIDPEHHPAAIAHTAIVVDDGIEARLVSAGLEYRTLERDGGVVHFCRDPAGNRWELRVG